MVQQPFPLLTKDCPSSMSACSLEQADSSQSHPPHAIPYQGSKRALARRIIEFFPANATRVVEPFAGSAAVSLAALHYGRVRSVLIGDSNEALINLWQEIVHRPEMLADAYTDLWHSQLGRERSFYDDVRRKFNQTGNPDLFLYLLARCVKASVRYNPRGEFNQSPDNRRRGAKPAVMRSRILGAARLLRYKSELVCGDYTDTLGDVGQSDVVYLDPPYSGVSNGRDRRYLDAFAFDRAGFPEVLRRLGNDKIPLIVSYDGRTGEKSFGEPLPPSVGLTRMEVNAGRSSQATLLGRNATTIESLYISPELLGVPRQAELLSPT